MFLLIRLRSNLFTAVIIHLHSTMFLLIPTFRCIVILRCRIIYIPLCFYLYQADWYPGADPTLIYIPLCFYLYKFRSSGKRELMNLHSTMFLLIRINVAPLEWVRGKFTFHYVSTYTAMKLDNMIEQKHLHSTMFLLIPIARKMIPGQSRFTFHYVSTYTGQLLLLRMRSAIYIPLCFYLYSPVAAGQA